MISYLTKQRRKKTHLDFLKKQLERFRKVNVPRLIVRQFEVTFKIHNF